MARHKSHYDEPEAKPVPPSYADVAPAVGAYTPQTVAVVAPTPADFEAVFDLFTVLRPEAAAMARSFILARTPPQYQALMQRLVNASPALTMLTKEVPDAKALQGERTYAG